MSVQTPNLTKVKPPPLDLQAYACKFTCTYMYEDSLELTLAVPTVTEQVQAVTELQSIYASTWRLTPSPDTEPIDASEPFQTTPIKPVINIRKQTART